MADVSLLRLYLLRAAYLLLVVGLGIEVWPEFVRHGPWELMQGVVYCVLAAVSLLAIIGLVHPLHMLPLLVFETVWKSIWLTAVAAPLWLTNRMDQASWATGAACLMGVIFPLVIPWRYVMTTYVTAPMDRWR